MKKLTLSTIILMSLQSINADAIEDANNNFINAVRTNNMQAIDQALKDGANLKTQGFSALMYAVAGNNEAMFDKLVSLGVSTSPTQLDNKGVNLLMRASMCGHINIMKKLLNTGEYNAPVINAQDKVKMSALARAAVYGRHEPILLLTSVPGVNKNFQYYYKDLKATYSLIDLFLKGSAMYRYQQNPGCVQAKLTEVSLEEQNKRKAAIIKALTP